MLLLSLGGLLLLVTEISDSLLLNKDVGLLYVESEALRLEVTASMLAALSAYMEPPNSLPVI